MGHSAINLVLTVVEYVVVYCLLTIGPLWLIGTQNITYEIQVNGKGFTNYTVHCIYFIICKMS